MLGLGANLAKGGASLLTYVKDNLKLYLDFKSTKSDTLKFPSEGSTELGGVNQTRYIDLGSDIEFTGDFSIGFWFNGDVNTAYKAICRTTTSPSNDILVKDVSGQIAIRIAGSYSANANNVPNNTWSHIVFTRDSNNLITAYVNGTSSTTNTKSGTFKFSKIGNNNYSAGADCKLTNFFAYTRCLSPEEVQSIQNKSYSQLKGVEKTSLVAWWSLDSASNGVVQPHDGESTTLISNRDFAGVADGTDPTTLSYIFAYGVPGEKTIDNERLKIVDSNNTGVYWKETGLTSSKLYKITVEATGDVASNGVYSSDLSFTLLNGTFTGYVTGKTQIIVYLRANNNNAGTTFYDNLKTEEITSNTGKVTGATTTTSVYGGNGPILPRAVDVAKEGQADNIGNGSASFDGNSNYIEIANSSAINIAGDMTITAWVNPSGTTSFRPFVFKRDSGGTNYQFYMDNSGTPKLRFFDGSGADSPDGSLVKDEWQHIAISIDSGATDGSIFYHNGIADSNTATFTISADDAPLLLGKHSVNDPVTFANMKMSQLGIWRGALTQSQIQSVFESTSYSKIPADVKSTLGNNVISYHSVDNVNNTFVNNIATFIANGYIFFSGVTPASTLFKFEYTVLTSTATGLRLAGGSSAFGAPGLESSVGTHTYYFVSDASSSKNFLSLNSTGFRGTITDILVKEVTNDIVAFYPLDADNSANGVTNDATTGEVLGSELIPDGEFTDTSLWDAGSDVAIGTGISFVNGQAVWATSGVVEIKQDITINSGKLYKVVLDIDSVTSGTIRNNVGSYGGSFTTAGVKTEYITGSGSRFYLVGFSGFNGVLNSVSVKEVLSNTGVLK